MKRLMENTVFCGLVMACRLAGSPILRSPPSTKPTTDGVVRLPSLFAITTGSLPSKTATQEFVVPKSIPIIFPIIVLITHQGKLQITTNFADYEKAVKELNVKYAQVIQMINNAPAYNQQYMNNEREVKLSYLDSYPDETHPLLVYYLSK